MRIEEGIRRGSLDKMNGRGGNRIKEKRNRTLKWDRTLARKYCNLRRGRM